MFPVHCQSIIRGLAKGKQEGGVKRVIPNLSLTSRLSLFSSLMLVLRGYRVPVYEALSQGFQYSNRAIQGKNSERLEDHTSEQDDREKELQDYAKKLMRKNRSALRAHKKQVRQNKVNSSKKRNKFRAGKRTGYDK
jgi:hypothetical protein